MVFRSHLNSFLLTCLSCSGLNLLQYFEFCKLRTWWWLIKHDSTLTAVPWTWTKYPQIFCRLHSKLIPKLLPQWFSQDESLISYKDEMLSPYMRCHFCFYWLFWRGFLGNRDYISSWRGSFHREPEHMDCFFFSVLFDSFRVTWHHILVLSYRSIHHSKFIMKKSVM